MPGLTKREFEKQFARIKERIKSVPARGNGAGKEARVSECESDALKFASEYLPHYFTNETPAFMAEWEELSEIKNRLVLIAAPRGHAKTTFFTLLKTLYWIAYKKRRVIIVASETGDMAERQTRLIKLELSDNERLKADFGQFENKGAWSDGEFVTRNGVMVIAIGKGAGIRGIKNGPYRPDAFVADDMENDEEQKNRRRIQKTLDWIREVIMPAFDPSGGWSAVVVGNILSKRSALKILIDDKHPNTGEALYLSRKYSALKKDGAPLWPERFTPDYLEQIKYQMGSRAFSKEYLNAPQDEDGMFKEGWIAEWPDQIHEMNPPSAISIYLDPSMGATSHHDMKATVATGRAGNSIDVLAARIRNESVGSMITGYFDLYESIFERFPEARFTLAYEDNGFQELLGPLFDEEANTRGLPVRVGGITNRVNKEMRIETLSPKVERGELRFKKGNTDQGVLIEQLIDLALPQVPDDGPDALEGSVRSLKDVVKGQGRYIPVSGRATSALAKMAAGSRNFLEVA